MLLSLLLLLLSNLVARFPYTRAQRGNEILGDQVHDLRRKIDLLKHQRESKTKKIEELSKKDVKLRRVELQQQDAVERVNKLFL